MRITVKELRELIAESVEEVMEEMHGEAENPAPHHEDESMMNSEEMEEVLLEAYQAGLLEGRKAKVKEKAAKKKLTASQEKKLDADKDGKITKKDFAMLRAHAAKKKSTKPVKK